MKCERISTDNQVLNLIFVSLLDKLFEIFVDH